MNEVELYSRIRAVSKKLSLNNPDVANYIESLIATVKQHDEIEQKNAEIKKKMVALVQDDTNMADDAKQLETQIADITCKVSSLNGLKGNLVKKLKTLKASRLECWKQYNELKSQLVEL